MASPSRQVGRLLALVSLIPVLSAALNITASETITAGVNTTITVGFDLWKQRYVYEMIDPSSVWGVDRPVCIDPPPSGCSTDMLYEHYQVYLYTPEWKNICYLTDLIPTGTTSPTITIPTDLGPEADSYQLTIIEFNDTTLYMPNGGVNMSNPFSLTHSSIAAWTRWESYGGWLKPYPSLPCSKYACWRDCGLKYADQDGNRLPGSSEALFNCWNSDCSLDADPNSDVWSWYVVTENSTVGGGSMTTIDYTSLAIPTATARGQLFSTDLGPVTVTGSASVTVSASATAVSETKSSTGATTLGPGAMLTMAFLCCMGFL